MDACFSAWVSLCSLKVWTIINQIILPQSYISFRSPKTYMESIEVRSRRRPVFETHWIMYGGGGFPFWCSLRFAFLWSIWRAPSVDRFSFTHSYVCADFWWAPVRLAFFRMTKQSLLLGASFGLIVHAFMRQSRFYALIFTDRPQSVRCCWWWWRTPSLSRQGSKSLRFAAD